MIKEYNPSDLVQAANDANLAAEEAIKPLHDMEVIKEKAKDTLAMIMCTIKEYQEGKVSETELERLARNHPRWVTFRETQYAIMENGITAKIKMQNAKLYFDAVQSAMSFRREEMKRLGD